MDMWTTQERCPHAHSRNNKYKSQSQVDIEAKNSGAIHATSLTRAHINRRQIAHRFSRGGDKLDESRNQSRGYSALPEADKQRFFQQFLEWSAGDDK